MKGQFPFESSIKQLVLHLDSLISNVEHFSSEGSEQTRQNVNNHRKINHILSCQIVNFGSEAGKLNNYDVYNYCHTLKKYENELEKHFKDITKNKSILSIEKERNDDGIWYSKRVPQTNATAEINLEYQKRTTVASYHAYSTEDECKEQWNNWCDLMFGIYENVNSVFSKNIRIELSRKKYLYSGIYITFACSLNDKQIGIIGRICETLLNDVAFKDLIPNLHNNIQTHALQSAVAQVFARNFAHNIGSHVAIRGTNRMAKQRIADLYNFKDANNKIVTAKFNEEVIVNWLDYIGEKLDLFEVVRNEFLAEYKLPAKNTMLYRDVILPFCENTLLMDNIAHSEGIHYKNTCENKLKIKVLINGIEILANYPNLKSYDEFEKTPIIYPYNFPYLVKAKDGTIDDAFANKKFFDDKGNELGDIEICLTNEHTLYSILENFIRNSAKHNKSNITEKVGLVITINIEDKGDDDYFEIQIYDNVSRVTREKLCDFKEAIQAKLIREDGEVERKNLGIADIKINTHLLKTDANITNENLSDALTLIYREEYTETEKEKSYTKLEKINGFVIFPDEPKCKNDKETELVKEIYNFGYQFRLCKPKKVIWIGQEDNPKLKERGIICIEKWVDFKPERQAKAEEPLANYQFAILELDAVKNLTNTSPTYEWDDFLIKLPHRVLLNCAKKKVFDEPTGEDYAALKELVKDGRIQLVENEIPLPTETEKNKDWDFGFLKNCWENWLRKWGINVKNKGNLIIYLEDTNLRENWDGISTNILNVYSSNNTLPPSKDILIEDGKTTVIYDHHSAGRNSLKVSKPENKFEKFVGNFIERDAYFCYDKGSSDYALLAFPSHKKEDKILFTYEAFEAGLKKIIVADERIADKIPFEDDKYGEIKKSQINEFKSKGRQKGATIVKPNLSDLCNNGNIFIVNKINKDIEVSKYQNCHLTFENNDTNIATLYFNDINEYNKKEFKIDALVIHRTYVQILLENGTVKQSGKDLMHNLYKKFKRIVIVSGGGKPHSMKIPMNFKPYSQLANTVVKYPSKINLNKIL